MTRKSIIETVVLAGLTLTAACQSNLQPADKRPVVTAPAVVPALVTPAQPTILENAQKLVQESLSPEWAHFDKLLETVEQRAARIQFQANNNLFTTPDGHEIMVIPSHDEKINPEAIKKTIAFIQSCSEMQYKNEMLVGGVISYQLNSAPKAQKKITLPESDLPYELCKALLYASPLNDSAASHPGFTEYYCQSLAFAVAEKAAGIEWDSYTSQINDETLFGDDVPREIEDLPNRSWEIYWKKPFIKGYVSDGGGWFFPEHRLRLHAFEQKIYDKYLPGEPLVSRK